MTKVARKIVTSDQVWEAYVNGIRNDMTAEQVCTNLGGMKIGSFRQAVNKLKETFVKDNPGSEFPRLKRNTKTGSKISGSKMAQDLAGVLA